MSSTDFRALKRSAEAASHYGDHVYTNARDNGNWEANRRFQALCTPAVVLELLADVARQERIQVAMAVSMADIAIALGMGEEEIEGSEELVNAIQELIANNARQAERLKLQDVEIAAWKSSFVNMRDRNSLLRERPDLPVDRLPAHERLIALQDENVVARMRIKELDLLFGRYILGMRAALIEAEHGGGDKVGMAWIWNALVGPGQLPPEDETDAQAYFDREIVAVDDGMQQVLAFHEARGTVGKRVPTSA